MNRSRYREVEALFVNEGDNIAIGHRIIKGTNNILISASHSVSQVREGKDKNGEYRTGLIAKILEDLTDCSIMYKTKNLGDDANYDGNCNYKSDLVNFVKANDIKIVIDLHISHPSRKFSVDIGTNHGLNLNGRLDVLEVVKSGLSEQFDDVLVDFVFPAAYEHTVCATVGKKSRIPAIQLEINQNTIVSYSKVEEFVNVMVEIVKKLEGILND